MASGPSLPSARLELADALVPSELKQFHPTQLPVCCNAPCSAIISAAAWSLVPSAALKMIAAGIPASARNQLMRRSVTFTNVGELVPGMHDAVTAVELIGTPSDEVNTAL